ncbi:glycosylphosphatidylinositol anchor biosynthesis [Malassezia yamatoensis]|uniref:Mannosyltransferase n=1 Tax=Malassezia yamatoensis TaxID=253288 RepID=A0AAJ5YTJ4_9BASI|nr:glycosylphosphatidylinositol anchor biosynthesis [Malassezia yamatoensis]
MPSIQQAIIAWIGDMYFFAYIREVISLRLARTWFIIHGLSLYWTYTCTRPFSNSTEATLFCIALYYWPRALDTGHKTAWMPFAKALLAAFTCVLFRPTSLVMWSFLGSKLVIDTLRYQSLRVALKCLVLAMLIGVLVLGGGFLLDSLYFGEATWTIRNFFVVNVVCSLSAHYGENVWHWYFTVGLPSVLTLLAPFSMFNWWRSLRVLGQGPFHSLAVLCFWTISAYSFLAHKEARFLQPVVPIMHLFAVQLFRPLSDSWKSCWRSIPKVLRYLLISQVPITLYVTMFHAHGQIAVMQYIHSVASPRTSVGFLMPCHSTPWQSHMHARNLEVLDLDNKLVSGDEGRAWFITCDPPLCHDPSTYWSQTDFFLEDPVKYLTERFPSKVDRSFPPMQVAHFRAPGPSNKTDVFAQHISSDQGWRHTWPTHLVMYSSLLDVGLPMTVGELLTRRGYREEKRFWNALWHPEKERQGDVVVFG